MSNLNFKYGLYENLPSYSADQEGTIFVTTDEGAMYINLDGKQIRMQGSVLYYDSVEEFTATTNPPYSTEALYFFRKLGKNDTIASNAIMAYNGTEWVQINVTLSDFKALGTRMGTVESSLANLVTLPGTVSGLSSKVDKNIQDIKDLKTLVGDNGETSLSSRVETLETNHQTLSKTVNELSSDVAEIAKEYINSEDLQGALDLYVPLESYTKDKETFALKSEVEQKVSSDVYNAKIASLENNDTIIGNKVSTLETKTGALETGLESFNGAVGELESRIGTLESTAAKDSDLQAYKGKTDSEIAALKSTSATKQELSTGLAEKLKVETFNNTIKDYAKTSDVNTALALKADNTAVATIESNLATLTTNAATKTELNTVKTNLEAQLAGEIKAANALHYVGGISTKESLPTTQVKIGDTYIVETTVPSENIAAGDLFIAIGTEGDDGYITTDLDWKQVRSGYDSSLNPVLTHSSYTVDGVTVGHTVKLSTYAGNSLGQINFTTDCDSIKFEPEANSNNVKVNMVWGTFGSTSGSSGGTSEPS